VGDLDLPFMKGSLADGQDDLIGGSAPKGFRDTGDTIGADGADDVVLGDNGSLIRTVTGLPGAQTERVYADRYPNGTPPAGATVARTHDTDLGEPSTRFCTEARPTCEVVGAFGNDTLYGELGDDTVFGNEGEDAILGDRGGV
jgi:hypothetical protein